MTLERRKRFFTILIFLNLAFIWGNSLLPGSVSGDFSRWVGELLQRIFSLPVMERPEGHHLLRKLAHFSEFACLGCLICCRIGISANSKKHVASRSWVLGFLAACVDETIQRFVEGRSSDFADVCLDSFGVAVGIVFLILGYSLSNRKT